MAEIAVNKIVTAILVILAVGLGLALVFKFDILGWINNLFPDLK